MEDNIIEITDLTKEYDELKAVDHLSLTINKGEIFGLLGPNGAGKSTTILMILGLTEPTSGSVRVCGIDSTTNPVEVKRKVGYLPEDVGFYDDYTGLENLVYTAMLNGIPGGEAEARAMELIERVGLTDSAVKKTGKYSRGMRQRLGLADVLIKNPEVIILDEPTLGIDPKGVHEFLELIVQLCHVEGRTVLLSSHHLHQVQEICDRVGLFVGGRLIAEGGINSLSRKLFSNDLLLIEAGVIVEDSEAFKKLDEHFKNMPGVETVKMNGNLISIGCSADITNNIARSIIESGLSLTHIAKKEYGLNDIYNRYFEGGKDE